MSVRQSAMNILAGTVGDELLDPQNPFGVTYQPISDEDARFFGRWWSERASPRQRGRAAAAAVAADVVAVMPAVAAAIAVNRRRGGPRRRAVAKARAAGIAGNKAIAAWILKELEIEISARQVGRYRGAGLVS